MRRLPLVPTLVVAAAVLAMIALGVWQLRRAGEKDRLLAAYAANRALPPIAWPTAPMAGEPPLFRRATGTCLQPVSRRAVAGRNPAGQTGYSHLVDCRTGAEGPVMRVDIGWSADPTARPRWTGGEVSGVIVPDRETRMRLVSGEGLAGLQPSVPPAIEDIPNNHRSYAFQWFAFAAIAALIYALALRRRQGAAERPSGDGAPRQT